MKLYKWTAIMLTALALSACDKENETVDNAEIDETVTETVLDDVDKIEGTISDAMINAEELDQSDTPIEDAQEGGKSEDGKSKNSESSQETETESNNE